MSTDISSPRKIADGLMFGEGIRWRGDKLVLSDMIGERVVEVDPATGEVATLLERPERPNGLVVLAEGDVLVLSMHDQKVVRLKRGGDAETYADLAGVATGYLGDAVQALNGDLYVDDVGTRPFHGEGVAPVGQLIRVTPGGAVQVVLSDLAFPNGVTISPDGRRLYLAQSLTQPRSDITAFDIGEDGALANRRTFATLDAPVDGMSMDEEEGVWACMPQAGAIQRLGRDGVATHRVTLDGHEPIACTLGGPDGRTLAIVAVESLKGANIFQEMQAKRVRAAVFLAEVPFAKGGARP